MNIDKILNEVLPGFPNLLNKIDLLDKDIVKKTVKNFSKDKNCEVLTLSTLEKDSISKIKAKLISYVS